MESLIIELARALDLQVTFATDEVEVKTLCGKEVCADTYAAPVLNYLMDRARSTAILYGNLAYAAEQALDGDDDIPDAPISHAPSEPGSALPPTQPPAASKATTADAIVAGYVAELGNGEPLREVVLGSVADWAAEIGYENYRDALERQGFTKQAGESGQEIWER